MPPSRKTAFVTGGTGFIGSHLVETLLKQGYTEVRCLVRTKPKWLADVDMVPVHATLGDKESILEAVTGVDYVYHLGGVTRAPTWEALYEGNVTATLNLLDAISIANPGIRKVCVMSTLAVIGQMSDTIADESTPLNPVSQYGRSKAAMEKALLAQFGSQLPVTVIRPPSVYGPRDLDVYTFFRTVNKGLCPILRGDPGISLVHVSDLVHGIIAATESDITAGETYFVGSDEVVTWHALRTAALVALKRKALTVHMPGILIKPLGALSELAGRLTGTYPPLNREKALEILYAAKQCSSAKARRDFGYQQQVPLKTGVQETIAWYQAHRKL